MRHVLVVALFLVALSLAAHAEPATPSAAVTPLPGGRYVQAGLVHDPRHPKWVLPYRPDLAQPATRGQVNTLTALQTADTGLSWVGRAGEMGVWQLLLHGAGFHPAFWAARVAYQVFGRRLAKRATRGQVRTSTLVQGAVDAWDVLQLIPGR
jgi:hypothetical protein